MKDKVYVKFPEIKEIRVVPETIDEWYGVEVRVTWKEPFDYIAFSREVKAEYDLWFKQNPGRCHVGAWPLEEALHDHVVNQVLAHPAWAKFYEKPRFVICEDGGDGPERRVQIPRFKCADFCHWEFNTDDGWVSASYR